PDYISYGCYLVRKTDTISGKCIYEWRFNLTRYAQNVLNGNVLHYDFRLFSPYAFREIYQPYPSYVNIPVNFPALNSIFGSGRVRLGGGSHPAQKMKMRVVYSKL